MKIPSIYAKGFEKTENGGLKMAQGHPSADSVNTKKAGMKETGKEIPMRRMESRMSRLTLLAMLASVLLAQSARAVTYTASLPIEPVHPRYAYCGSFDIGLRNVLFDAGDIEDDEHDVVEVENNLHWAVRDAGGTVVAEMDAEVATVSSSLPGGSGFIYSPGEYTMTFTGYVKYNVIVHDEDGGSTTEGPFTVPLTASGGGRLSMPFAFVGVGCLSCGGVTSATEISALFSFIEQTSHWGYFNTFANWAEDAVQAVVSENVDSSDYAVFGTPRAISQSIINLETEHPTQRDIPLFGGEDAPCTSSGSASNGSSSFDF